MRSARQYNNTTTARITTRINYLLAKYSVKLQQETMQHASLPEPDRSLYLDDDPNFLPFYGMV